MRILRKAIGRFTSQNKQRGKKIPLIHLPLLSKGQITNHWEQQGHWTALPTMIVENFLLVVILTGFPSSSCDKLNCLSQMSIKFHFLSSSAKWNEWEVLERAWNIIADIAIIWKLSHYYTDDLALLRIHPRCGTSTK
jgi:hypothetical protein